MNIIIKILLVLSLFIISCGENKNNKRKYLVYDLDSKFPTLMKKDSLSLFLTSQNILDSILKKKDDNIEVLEKQIQRSLINSDSLTYIILYKTNEKEENTYLFYFDDNFNFLKFENEE